VQSTCSWLDVAYLQDICLFRSSLAPRHGEPRCCATRAICCCSKERIDT
jgi:hypothetical protein